MYPAKETTKRPFIIAGQSTDDIGEGFMDVHQLEYILMISEEKSIARAAEKLFISQSALNQQLQKLESELGTALFVRTRSDWQPTPAGEIYLETAKTILALKKDAYSKIHDMAEFDQRHFIIGLIPERGVDMFTSIYPQFHRLYPDIILEPVECNVRTMQKRISKGEIDLGLMTLTRHQKDENTYVHMAYEEIVLAVPSSHPLAKNGSRDAQNAPEIALESFAQDPFILIYPASTMHQLVRELFTSAGFDPKVLFSTSSNISKYRMVNAGVGCALLPAVFAVPSENIVFFRLPQHPHWEVTMCCRKDAYLSKVEKAYINLCHTYWSKVLP